MVSLADPSSPLPLANAERTQVATCENENAVRATTPSSGATLRVPSGKSVRSPSGETNEDSSTAFLPSTLFSGGARPLPPIYSTILFVLLSCLALYLFTSLLSVSMLLAASEPQQPLLDGEGSILEGPQAQQQLLLEDRRVFCASRKNRQMKNFRLPIIQNSIDGCPKLPEVPYGKYQEFGTHYPCPETYSRSECLCTPVHNFVIASMQRSGSGWFETLLNFHPNVSSHGELFSKHPRRHNFSTISDTLSRVYNLDWNSSAAKNECTSAVGLKWMLNQGLMEYHQDILSYFQTNRVSIILLLRRNALRRLISILANAYDQKQKLLDGEHKSHVHSKEEAKKLASYRPRLDTKTLLRNLQRVVDIASEAQRVFSPARFMLVYYEDVARNKTILEDVQRFLGVPLMELQSRQVKIHTKTLKEQIENFDEVASVLNGTDLYRFVVEEEKR